jgi:tetratricopeptide (TPR) repeat protein
MLEAARDHLSQSTQLARQIPDFYSLIFGGGQLGQCLLDRGEIEPALAILEESRQISRQHNIRGNAVTPHYHGLMKAYLLLAGRTERALKVKWLAKASGASRDVRKQARSFRGGLPEALLLNGHLARLKGNPAKTRRLWQRSLQEAEQMGMQSMLALAHREIGQYFGEQEHLARAEAIFLELGVVEKPARIIR